MSTSCQACQVLVNRASAGRHNSCNRNHSWKVRTEDSVQISRVRDLDQHQQATASQLVQIFGPTIHLGISRCRSGIDSESGVECFHLWQVEYDEWPQRPKRVPNRNAKCRNNSSRVWLDKVFLASSCGGCGFGLNSIGRLNPRGENSIDKDLTIPGRFGVLSFILNLPLTRCPRTTQTWMLNPQVMINVYKASWILSYNVTWMYQQNRKRMWLAYSFSRYVGLCSW